MKRNLFVLCFICLVLLFVAGCVGPRYVVVPQQPVAALTGTNAPVQSVVYQYQVVPQQTVVYDYPYYPHYSYPRYYPPVSFGFGLGWGYRDGYHYSSRHYRPLVGHYGGQRGGSRHYGHGGHRR